jgi:hypothetical protein
MDRTYKWIKDERETDFYQDMDYLIKKNPWSWQSVCAVLGLAGGVIAPFIGAASGILTWYVVSPTVNSYLHVSSIVFCALTIPLLALGACCLDMLETKAAARLSLPTPAHNEATPATAIRHNARRDAKHRLNGVGALAALVLLLVSLPASAYAQQTIFNVPSSDVLDRGKVYGELDVTFKPNDADDNAVGRFSSFVPRVVFGTGGRVEVGLNLTGNINPGADSTTLVPAIKWNAYDGGANGWSIVLGDNAFIPMRNKSYDFGNYVYAQASKTFKSRTRLTAGGYHFSDNVVAANAQRAGGQFGFEQPISDKFGVAADWYTGKHAAGYFTPGFNFKPHPKVTGYVGYSIGNTGASNGNHFFYTAIGINFN